jgi:succinyl-diaminopimelate desuccinylase
MQTSANRVWSAFGSVIAPLRKRWPVPAVAVVMTLAPAFAARAATDFLELRERLQVERPKFVAGMQPYIRATTAEAFPSDKPGVAFGKYLDLVWKTLDAKTTAPEVYKALGAYRGKLDPSDATARQALGVLLGDYLQVRYGTDIRRELGNLVAFKTFSNVVDRNADNEQVRACFDAIQKLATGLGLQVQNQAYETLQITLPAAGTGVPALALYTHADVARPIDHKWTSPPFKLAERDGRLYGAGVADDKSALLVNLFALRVLRDAGLQLVRPIVLVVSSSGLESGSQAAASFAKVTPKPALALAADGEFPYATGELGRGILRVSSTRGMKSRAGLKPGQYYVHKMTSVTGAATVPSEVRVWVRYQGPLNENNPALVMSTKWRTTLEGYQKEHPESVYETYIQEDTLHFFVYGKPRSVLHADQAVNSMYDAAGALQRYPIFMNSASDILTWIDKGLQRDGTGKNLGMQYEDATMGTTRVSPVGLDRLGDEVSVLVDVRWPVGHDAAWIRDKVAASIADYNRSNETKLTATWEPATYEPARLTVAPAVQSALDEAYVLASGEGAAAVATTGSDSHLLPGTIPFGPAWPRGEPQAHARDESIAWSQIQDMGVAYMAALAALATAPLPAHALKRTLPQARLRHGCGPGYGARAGRGRVPRGDACSFRSVKTSCNCRRAPVTSPTARWRRRPMPIAAPHVFPPG